MTFRANRPIGRIAGEGERTGRRWAPRRTFAAWDLERPAVRATLKVEERVKADMLVSRRLDV